MSNLIKRAIFGAIYVALILGALLLESPTLYMIVFGLIVSSGHGSGPTSYLPTVSIRCVVSAMQRLGSTSSG